MGRGALAGYGLRFFAADAQGLLFYLKVFETGKEKGTGIFELGSFSVGDWRFLTCCA